MTAGTQNFTIEQGADFSRVITWKDSNGDAIDLTGYTARMQGRESVTASDTLLELTTENSGIALGGVAGTITLAITAAATSAIDADSGVYDLELISSGGTVTRLLQGDLIFSKEVTR